MGKIVGYGKIGRSMPLTLEKCGTLGGDVEMVPVVKDLALRHPDDTFILIGRNSGEKPADVGLPPNVVNPWTEWAPELRKEINKRGFNYSGLSHEDHFKVADLMDEFTRESFEQMDAIVMWIGQHGTSNRPLPGVQKKGWTKPQDWCAYYSGFLLRGINYFRDRDPFCHEEVWLNADSRNYLKMRDLAWPLQHPVLTQFNFEHLLRHEREWRARTGYPEFSLVSNAKTLVKNDVEIWLSTVKNVYSRLEINALTPNTPFGDLIEFNDDWADRQHFGLFINQAGDSYCHVSKRRETALRNWVLPLNPAFVHGTWTPKTQEALNLAIAPVPWNEYYPKLHSVRSTFTTPSSGSGYATTKPWEAFAAGTVCFFHPQYDVQDNILADADPALKLWLRVGSPEELALRVKAVDEDRATWEWLVAAQKRHFDRAITDLRYLRMIEERIYG